MKKIDLSGKWEFCLDSEKEGIEKNYCQQKFQDYIELPATVSTARKGVPSKEEHEGFLTDPYSFEGYTWYTRMVELSTEEEKEYFLVLERTRISHVWLNEQYIGSNTSLCTSHRYQLTPYVKQKNWLTIMIDNTSYPVKGGHMTSPDTQTNWNGITGKLYIEECSKSYLTKVRIYPNAKESLIEVKVTLNGSEKERLEVWVSDEEHSFPIEEYMLQGGENTVRYYMGHKAKTWSEHTPNLYQLHMGFYKEDKMEKESWQYTFGLRDFKATGKYFEINGVRTFLRGKHDGLLFPLTGHAPTDLESWIKVLETAKQYGINHYRFHTCCPTEAAFEAADMLGIYMEPELPFWGTVTEEGQENHDEKGQQYLIEEGFRILDEFGNHPSFVMMSMGNELWGSKERLNQILGEYRNYDARHLYTQGSNNFQFVPCILDNEDFFCGVRFSKDRLLRGSYAMCDAPQGHIQTMAPDLRYNYDQMIRPAEAQGEIAQGGEITIQYGTGTKSVKMDTSMEMIPEVPVVSHEIGQYAMFPDFSEIPKYSGVLKARNFEIFQKRLEAAGMLSMADSFFRASGKLAVDCYKAELETAFRSNELAGFQILDLQDFTGQGTAIIGILNALMESKGLVLPGEWRQFCSDRVILLELPKLVFTAGEIINVGVKLSAFGLKPVVSPEVSIIVRDQNKVLLSEKRKMTNGYHNGVYQLEDVSIAFPERNVPEKLVITAEIVGTDIKNSYTVWIYPKCKQEKWQEDFVVTESIQEACESLRLGKKVLLYPESLNEDNSIKGTYCTDFWCYPMFRTISESMGKAVPIGTLGLLIEDKHPVFKYFPTESYTTAQWYDFVSNSRAFILDKCDLKPIVWSIDNFERNHKLGNIFEVEAGKGKLLVCTSDLRRLSDSNPSKWLEYSMHRYICSDKFKPSYHMEIEELEQIFRI
ncbi:sugar-binding domain-containing protein [Anaeromicropila populeti]|uniref:beta-galactosidase n=1 Tax=Anaeromicropila populeti TaxID=37658 RepID=A0A1I6LKK1_9FIRM|nr:sugar-binding domain-containing protein [Anaeromicropila populeti]SFS03830.1 Glycosyl hydrolases family 2, TIM barrel domain [Anaeromicropila populeti]